jgi:hypothetical protein
MGHEFLTRPHAEPKKMMDWRNVLIITPYSSATVIIALPIDRSASLRYFRKQKRPLQVPISYYVVLYAVIGSCWLGNKRHTL